MAISISKATIVSSSDTGLPAPSEDTTIGNYSIPSGVTSSSDQVPIFTEFANNGRDGTTGGGFNGFIFAVQHSGLTVGQTITHIRIKVVTAVGNVRVKLYTDDGAGNPSALVAESGAVALSVGNQDVALTASFDVPANGIVWSGAEVSSASAQLEFQAGAAGERRDDTHVFGAGDDPFTETASSSNPTYFGLVEETLTNQPVANIKDNNTGTYWRSTSEVNPNVYMDCDGVGNLNLIGCAFMPSSENEETEFLIQTSTDAAAWTTVGTVQTLTAATWIFVRFNMKVARYIRIYGNSGSSVAMAISEIKYKSDSSFPSDHLHNDISSTTVDAGVSTT